MKATELQQQIAKELCLQLLQNNAFLISSVDSQTPEEYNTQIGEEIGALYQTLLTKVCKTETI